MTTNVTLTANHTTSSATIKLKSVNTATNTTANTSTAATITRTKAKDDFDRNSVLILLILVFGIISLCVFFIAKKFHGSYDNLQPEVQVNSTSFLSISTISYPQTTTTFNMVFSFRIAWPHANYSLILATMYLHRDHKYLSDKGLPSFVLKPSEETQVKAKFGLIDNLLASDLADREVNAEVELMFAVVFKLPFGVEAIYLGRFVCSDLKFANSSSKVGWKWIMLGGTKNCKDVSE